jgi:ABC-2 type transport system permease protein
MFERLITMLRKEFIQIFRDRKMRFIIFVIPVVQIMLFGYAVNTDVKHIATAIWDGDNSDLSRELLARLKQSGYFTISEHVTKPTDIVPLIDHGLVKAGLQINPGFAATIRGGQTASLALAIDGTDPNTARIVLSHAAKIVERFNEELLAERVLRQQGEPLAGGRVELASRAWFNANLESRNYYVPGVTALMVLITSMMLSSMAVVKEKEIGTMEQIIVTPIKRWEFIIGKTLPFALIGFIHVTIVSLMAVGWFQVPLRGNILLLYGATALYLMSTLGFGLFISTISRTQQQAMMSSFMFTFPAMLLSGFAFPIENMPPAIQLATYLNPLRYYLIIIRGVFLKGVGAFILWPQLAGLFLLGSTILTIAVLRFRKSVG